MSLGLDNLKHIVVLMMENRSFDHMLGALKGEDARINGLTGNESNLDTENEPARVQPNAEWQSQLDPDPNHHFPAVQKQLFYPAMGPPAAPNMQGFVQSYFDMQRDVNHSRKIMYYFTPEKLPVLTTLARSFAVFNGWFASIPGPTICNRAFAHYGTSFGSVTMDPFEIKKPIASIYDRMLNAGRTTKLYYFDQASSTMEVVNLLSNQPKVFGTYDQFLSDCKLGSLPDYSFIEPNYTDHEGDGGGELLASDQHPDHDVQEGEVFIAAVYNAIRQNPDVWKSTALLVVYDEHGGIYDHVAPPSCTPDGFTEGSNNDPFIAPVADTGTGYTFAFDRLGIRVPAVLISPWIRKSTVVPGSEDPANGRIFDHASIPRTVTDHFIDPAFAQRSWREKSAGTFLDLLSDTMRPDSDCPVFQVS
ncbi:MAG: alkaline phosphatase family protein [Bryobacterales bacterium]|nr:alkaline phosphatase family protein [Bryobacterales bacterium]MBV9401667.1 alkaline phosphatase family protein [Bryobacterales bacterium]